MGFLGQLGPSLLKVLPMLDERSRRLVLGMAAEAEGKGGAGRVAALTGASWQTVANGKAELDAEEEPPPGRQRRPGGGRKPLAETDPGLAAALEKLIRDAMRGDPESPLVWTTRSAEHLAGELTAAGHPCSDSTAWRMLRRMGFTQQSNSRAQEGRQHPERDGQFRHIAARSRGYLESGDPVISVDSKKREKVGNFGQDGRERAPAGDPVTVRSHDFPDRKQAHAIPYGIYDEKDNAGFVNVGTDGNTAALAVESVRRWWRAVGRDAYPGARRLLVTCDSGGSNGCTNKAWKALAALARETGLDIEVCHFPPGTQCRCLSAANYRSVSWQPSCMMPGMHPWTGLADDVRLGVLTKWVTAELVDEVLAECGTRDQRPGALPARFMVYYVLALALFQQDSYDDVAENLVGALEGMDEAIPNRSSFTRARQRLGAGVIEAVFRRLAGPVAPAGLAGAFWRGMRVAAVDGFVLDVPDTPVNRAAFGGPVDAKGQPAGFPQARVVTLTETGTHSSIDASVGGFRGGEPELAIAMATSAAGMLVIMDRGFPGVALWKAYTQARAHLLIRARSSVARRPVQVLEDGTYLARMNLAGRRARIPAGSWCG